jgi:DNA-binding transcriptional MocR family regulator
MAKQRGDTYIKLFRSIENWRWYKNPNTFRVFVHLLLNANIEDHDFESVTIHRGQLATSHASIAKNLDLSVQSVRTALEHLKSTGEITTKRYSKFLVISVLCYNQYQDVPTGKSTINQQSSNNHSTFNQQQLKNVKNGKKLKNNIGSATPPQKLEWYEDETGERRCRYVPADN